MTPSLRPSTTAIKRLEGAGVRIVREKISLFAELAETNPMAASASPRATPCIATA